MAENDGMEGKDLAKDKMKDAKASLLKEIEALKIKPDSRNTLESGLVVTNVKGQYTLSMGEMNFAIIQKDGKLVYNKQNLMTIKKKLEASGRILEDLGLPSLEQAIDQEEKEQKEVKKQVDKGQEEKTEKDEKKPELEENKNEENEQKQSIAETLGISPDKIYFIKKDSQFYKNHPGMFQGKNNFFYEDSKGVFRAGKVDKAGKPVEDTEHFSPNQIKQMKQVIRLGDGREDVKKEIPIQTISMVNPAKGNEGKDVQDRYIAVFRGNGGYVEFDEVEQPRDEAASPVAKRIEILRRDDNTQEINEVTHSTRSEHTPSSIARQYDTVENSGKASDGIQLNEVLTDLKEQIKADLIRTRGPMQEERLEKMTNDVLDMLYDGVDYDKAISKAGIEQREEGGRTPGETAKDPRR